MSTDSMNEIQLTRPYMPPLEEFLPYLEEIWKSQWLTNSGQFHRHFELALSKYLNVEHISVTSNGTLALIVAAKALGLSGEVITTPFTFPATTHALLWAGLTPVFVDIDPATFNLDPALVERAVSSRTSAILAVHVFGVPCDLHAIDQVAQKHGLKVLYDAAHAFGTKVGARSVLSYGHAAAVSFHATKLFSTFEGGAIISETAAMKARVDSWKNFGIADEVTVVEPGLNAKMSEFQAAFGLLQLKHIGENLRLRKLVADRYRSALCGVPGVAVSSIAANVTWNFAYFPIRVTGEYRETREQLYARLRSKGVMVRRYFYPLTSSLPSYRHMQSASDTNLPNANRIAEQILCLPIYAGLTEAQQRIITDIIVNPAC